MVKLKSNEAWDLEVEWEKFVVKVEWAGGGGRLRRTFIAVFLRWLFIFLASHHWSVNPCDGYLQEISFWKLTVQTWRKRIINQ